MHNLYKKQGWERLLFGLGICKNCTIIFKSSSNKKNPIFIHKRYPQKKVAFIGYTLIYPHYPHVFTKKQFDIMETDFKKILLKNNEKR